MRTIKFRVWDKTLNKWVNHISAINASGILLYLSTEVSDTNQIKHNIFTVSPERSVTQQFTGLIDKNGKAIVGLSEKVVAVDKKKSTPVERAHQLGAALAKAAIEKAGGSIS